MVRAFDAAETAFGAVDILVNNAGVAHADRAVELSEAEWRRVLGTNLDAVLFWAQEAARRLIAAGKGGAIVNISSVLGFGVAKGVIAYATAKAGVIQLTRALGLELASKGHPRQRHRAGLDRHRPQPRLPREREGRSDREGHPLGRFGAERDLDGVAAAAGLRCRPLHDRRDGGGRRRTDGRRCGIEFLLNLP